MAAMSKSSEHALGVFPDDDANPERMAERLHRLEDELVELRAFVAKLGDMFVGPTPSSHGVSGTSGEKPAGEAASANAVLLSEATAAARGRFGGWLPLDIFRELAQTARMYLDPRYRLRRLTQIVVPAIVALLFGSYFLYGWLFAIPILSPILDRLTVMGLAILLYRVLASELVRYRHYLATFAEWNNLRKNPAYFSNGEPPHTEMEMG